MEAITKKQEQAIKRLNSALKNAHKNDVFLAGMDGTLYYATQYAQDNTENEADYCEVARAAQVGEEGPGSLYSKNYQDSGGW